jgi:hypothetical protein
VEYTLGGKEAMLIFLLLLLVTLVLLLAVSGAIIVRSVMMRRRHQRMVAEAIRNGTYVPPSRDKVKLGERPVLFDIHLGMSTEEDGNRANESNTKDKEKGVWLMPRAFRWQDVFVS